MTTQTDFRYDDLPSLMTRMTGDEKHSTAATSTLDVVWVLYDRILSIDPRDPADPDRDRFFLSKGHGPMAYYAVLAAKGFISPDVLDTFATFDSPLGHHPDATLIAGVEFAAGSLGHGLPVAVGSSLALGIKGSPARVFCLLGDAELDEGSNHEAIVLAGRYALDRLTVVVIDNNSSSHAWPGGIARRFEVEGWSTATIDGRDHEAIEHALGEAHAGSPRAVVAVVQGKY